MSDNFICDSPSDEDDDSPLPMPRTWRQEDCLEPEPPPYWIWVFAYPNPPTALDVGCWTLALETFQSVSKEARWPNHMIARTPEGMRVLLVHPDLCADAREFIEEMNCAMLQCNCGGSDCLNGDAQVKAMRVFAKRAWPKVPIADRVDLLLESDAENLGMALDDSPDFSDVEDSFLLERIAEGGG